MYSYCDRRRGTERRLEQVAVTVDQRVLSDRRAGMERRSGSERRDESRIDIQNDRRTYLFEY